MELSAMELEIIKTALKYSVSHGNISSDEKVNERNRKSATETIDVIQKRPKHINAENIRIIAFALNIYVNSMQKSAFPVNAESLQVAEDLLYEFEEEFDEAMKKRS